MSQSNNQSNVEVQQDSSAIHTPASTSQQSAEQTPATLAPTVQRAVSMAGSSSPQTPPASFGALLNHQQSSTAMRAGVLRQLQHSYGNIYVGEVLQSSAGNSTPVQLAGLPENPPANNGAEDLSQRIQSASTGGRGLEAGLQNELEHGLGADLSSVRVHTDKEADTLARSVNATAFTSGRDIYFSDGAYQPNTESGMRLLAHEATHTIQQSRGPVAGTSAPGGIKVSNPADADEQAATRVAESVTADAGPRHGSDGSRDAGNPTPSSSGSAAVSVQRYGGAGGAPPVSEQKQTTSNPKIGSTLAYAGYVLSTNAEDMFQVLCAEATKNGYEGARGLAQGFHHGGGILGVDEFANDEPLATQISEVLIQQLDALNVYRSQLFSAYEGSATVFTNAVLDESVKIIKQEVEHYGLKTAGGGPDDVCVENAGPETEVAGEQGFAKRLNNTDAAVGLVQAAKELFQLRTEIKRLSLAIVDTMPVHAPKGGSLPPTREQLAERAKLEEKLKEVDRQYQLKRVEKEAEFPILAAYADNLSGLEEVKKGTFSAAREIGPLIVEKLNNVKKVRKDVDKLIWKQDTVFKGTQVQLGVEEKSLDAKLLQEHASDIKWSETLSNLAAGALAIGLGLIAAIPTGGASLAASIAVTSAAVAGASLTAYQAVAAIQQYQLESAASGTSFDKAKAISQDDPSLFWLALDIVAAIVDIRGAFHAYKALSEAVRAAIASRMLIKEGEAAAKAFGIGVKELEAIKSATGNNAGLYESILAHIGEAADAGKLPVKELEEAARAQYKVLKESGRLTEIGEISEELFVKQMTSGARSHIIVSGAEGVKRTKIITSLLDPASPVLNGILKGDVAAMDALLVQHGNWKQLISMLDQGTPEMRKAAAKLVARRAEMEAELAFFFEAKQAGKPSVEHISDIDLATGGQDAGKLMIEAEEWVASHYGKGWSEALRMNFYTEATRLSQYEKVMSKLPMAQRGALLEKLTEETEIYNIAKMMEHAHGNEELLKDAKAYAQRLKINIDDPRIQQLLPEMGKGVSIAERNKMLLEIDALMRRYRKAVPGSDEQFKLAEEITRKQMRANLFTEEAYIGPGAGRMVVGRYAVVGHEAYQAALSNIEMIFHTIGSNGGDIVLSMRQYEIYKYMSRFAEAAELAGVKHPMLQNWKAISKSVYKGERQALEDISYLRPGKAGTIIDPDITDIEARNLYDSWRSFSQKVLDDMKTIADKAPPDWTPARE